MHQADDQFGFRRDKRIDDVFVILETIIGKTAEQAQHVTNAQIASALSLPPVKIHCGQMVEGALRSALSEDEKTQPDTIDRNTLVGSIGNPESPAGKIKINITKPEDTP